MNHREIVLEHLASTGIPYTLSLHEPVQTVDDCLRIGGIDWSDVMLVKNVFLCNRQQTAFYLALLRHDVPFRTAVVSRALGVSRLSFAPETYLPDMLGLEAGAVSPLGLLFDREQRVTLAIDAALRDVSRLAFHPCDRAATVVLETEDFLRFLSGLGRAPHWIDAMEKP